MCQTSSATVKTGAFNVTWYVSRVGALNVPVAYYPDLEEAILPQSADILNAIRETATY